MAELPAIERLEEERRAAAADIKEVYAEGTGFDTKIMRQIIRIRKMADLPLGEAALRAAAE